MAVWCELVHSSAAGEGLNRKLLTKVSGLWVGCSTTHSPSFSLPPATGVVVRMVPSTPTTPSSPTIMHSFAIVSGLNCTGCISKD
jgi:hypothetical protein